MSGKSTTIRFLIASALSLLGNSVAGIALPLILLATTGDPLAAGTLALACAVPQVLAGVLGGAVLDRLNRRNVSIVSDIVSALCVAALPLIDMTVGLSFGWFVLFGILGAVGDIPGMTARDAMLPTVVERDGVDLQRFLGSRSRSIPL
ncbi:MFS transporter [Raoultibacter massiliensis]|uniref:MFS transporter n=1 Tax=Raoultibacter massiliensis TaxID=1852371 RepID=UPI003A92C3CB